MSSLSEIRARCRLSEKSRDRSAMLRLEPLRATQVEAGDLAGACCCGATRRARRSREEPVVGQGVEDMMLSEWTVSDSPR